MRVDRALPLRPVARSDRRRPPSWQEVEDKEVNWVEDKEVNWVKDKEVNWVEDKRLYLPSTGQVGDSLYSNTGRQCIH
jgi:hypothetical protein